MKVMKFRDIAEKCPRVFDTMRVDDATSDNFVIVVPAKGTKPASEKHCESLPIKFYIIINHYSLVISHCYYPRPNSFNN